MKFDLPFALKTRGISPRQNKKAGGLSPASRLNHLAGAALIQSNACSSIRASTSKSALP
jgi:hypothetical protein